MPGYFLENSVWDTYFQLALSDIKYKDSIFFFHGSVVSSGGNGLMIPQKLNVKPPYNSRTLLGRGPKERRAGTQAGPFTLIFIAVVFTTAKHEPSRLPTNRSKAHQQVSD